MTPRVVFDCMIYLQAAWSPTGPAEKCLQAAESLLVDLCVMDAIYAEIRDVLNRPRRKKKFAPLSSQEIDEFIARVTTFASRIDPVPPVVSLSRDPKDEKYLNLAIAANAVFVVSRDNDLLDLMTGTDAEATAFRTAYPGILILDPVAFLATLPQTP